MIRKGAPVILAVIFGSLGLSRVGTLYMSKVKILLGVQIRIPYFLSYDFIFP